MLSIKKFSKQYPGNTEAVLRITNFDIDKGIYWIKGKNGAGKTSLFKSIAGIIPFDGHIEVAGLDVVKDRQAYTRIVNYAEAEPKYPPFLNGKELIDFYRETKGGHFPEDLSASLGVNKFMQQKTGAYSSGMLKKLSLVLAFTGNPALILLDEPLVALDIASVDILHSTILRYSKKGVSFLITSHQPLNTELVTGTPILLLKDKTLQKETL